MYILCHTIVYNARILLGAASIERSVGTHAEAALGGAINGLAAWGLTWRKFPPKIPTYAARGTHNWHLHKATAH